MLPNFTIRVGALDGLPRFYVDTDWWADQPPSTRRSRLVVTTGGRLALSSNGWPTREKAEEAIAASKKRLAW